MYTALPVNRILTAHPAAKTSLRSNDCVKMQAQSRIAPGFASNDCGKMLAP
jgi:hypothetical protein